MTATDDSEPVPVDELPAEELRYPQAMAELDAILAGLERDDLDVDELGAKVARAAALIRWCRSRVHDARMEVEQIVVELE